MSNLFDVQNLCVLISGSSRGIGFELAQGFLDHGAKVTISSENQSELDEAFKKLDVKYKNRISAVLCDVRSSESCEKAVSKIISDFGSLTTTICNAGVDIIKPVESYSGQDWKFILDVNLQGAFNFSQAAIQYYLKNKIAGTVTFTSSIAGSVGINGLVPYAASKGGINQLTKTMAVELAKHNIRVNAVAPGYVENIMTGVTVHAKPDEQERIRIFTPLGRKCLKKELVGPYIFLASSASSYVTGHILCVDGGYTAI
jgi:NAD(P)-dependent dehydrogenase (short-subunit alcohol dehydrogenase family)